MLQINGSSGNTSNSSALGCGGDTGIPCLGTADLAVVILYFIVSAMSAVLNRVTRNKGGFAAALNMSRATILQQAWSRSYLKIMVSTMWCFIQECVYNVAFSPAPILQPLLYFFFKSPITVPRYC